MSPRPLIPRQPPDPTAPPPYVRRSAAKFPAQPKVCTVCGNPYCGKSWPGYRHIGHNMTPRPKVCSFACYERKRHQLYLLATAAIEKHV